MIANTALPKEIAAGGTEDTDTTSPTMDPSDRPDSNEVRMKAESIGTGLAVALGLVCVPFGLALLISGPLWLLVTLLLGVLCGWLAHVRGLDWRVFGVCGAVAWPVALPMAMFARGNRVVALVTVCLFVVVLVLGFFAGLIIAGV